MGRVQRAWFDAASAIVKAVSLRYQDARGIHVEGQSADETSSSASSIVWELADAGGTSASMSSNHVLELILSGRIGFASKIRRAPDGPWANTVDQREFGYAFPYVNLPLLALNLRDKEQQRTLRASGSPVAAGMRGNLSFSVPPRSWTIQLVSVPATSPSGFHKIAFRTRSGAERAATAAAVGVLTLGSFIYAPGSSGFDLQYEILTPEATRIVESWEAFAMEAADKRFEAAHAKGISDRRGREIAKESALQRFRAYLTPALVVGVLEDKRQTPRQSFVRLFDEFLFDWLGFRGAETAFRAG